MTSIPNSKAFFTNSVYGTPGLFINKSILSFNNISIPSFEDSPILSSTKKTSYSILFKVFSEPFPLTPAPKTTAFFMDFSSLFLSDKNHSDFSTVVLFTVFLSI